jgi:hypothetical protein
MSKVVVRRAAFLLLSWAAMVHAEGEAPPAAPPSDNAIPPEPEITITHRGEERIEEYSINNRVYMIKVTPAKGYPYYLIDTTGNGNFDTRRNGLDPKVTVPQWVLLNWK